MKKLLVLAYIFCFYTAVSQEKTDKLLVNILNKKPELFGKILAEPSKYRVQILYTQIDRDKNNTPTFRSYAYRLNKEEYFYPASTVKFPACLLALEKINQLKIKGSIIADKFGGNLYSLIQVDNRNYSFLWIATRIFQGSFQCSDGIGLCFHRHRKGVEVEILQVIFRGSRIVKILRF